MARLSIQLLGSFRVRCGAVALTGLDAGKVQELFGFLLLHRNRTLGREQLAGILWGDCPTAQARKNLRQSLWQFQSALGAYQDLGLDQVLAVNPESVRFDASSGVWLDVAVVEDAFMSVRGIAGDTLSPEQANALQDAVQVYTGDLLEGWYQDWCVRARATLQHAYIVMLHKLMAFCEAHGAYEEGIAHGERILRCDVASERTHRQMMRLHALAGDRTEALRQYDRCVAALDQELDVAPARSTLALLAQIRADQLGAAPWTGPRTPMPPEAEPETLPEVVQHLRQLQVLLIDLHQQLQHDIHTIEVAQTPT